jgi:hypothetical protein
MLFLPARRSRFCDSPTRRELVQIGGISMLGLMLPEIMRREANASDEVASKSLPQAKSVILLFLQGGPSHLDIWDPKPDAPDDVRSVFNPIDTCVPGIQLCETMPLLAQQMDKATLIRSMSYTPVGLFNHTAAMYQMLTGYTTDKVSPSGQLEPPSPKDFPTIGSQVARIRPPDEAMLPFVMMPRPLQESNVVGKGGTAGFLGKAYDPYYFYQDPNGTVKLDDLSLRPGVMAARMRRRAALRDVISDGMPDVEQAVEQFDVDKYYDQALSLLLSGRARDALDLRNEAHFVRQRYGRHTFGQSVLLARRLIEAGTRFVQVNWTSVANGDPRKTAWDCHAALNQPMKELHCPKLDSSLSALLEDLDQRGMLDETLVIAVGEFGRSPKKGVSTSGNSNAAEGRDHWPYCYTALIAGAGIKRGSLYGASDGTASAPIDSPVHPTDLLATVYHTLGIDPATIVYNHLNQPRELVKGTPITGLF